jgi:hypothetical protein
MKSFVRGWGVEMGARNWTGEGKTIRLRSDFDMNNALGFKNRSLFSW